MVIVIDMYMHCNFQPVGTNIAVHICINDNEHYINGNVR